MAIKNILILIFASFITGCSVPGRLFTYTTEPYTEDFNNTPVGSKTLILHDYTIKEPVSGYSISAQWTSGEILNRAAEAGMTSVYYADVQTFAILSGIYKRQKLIIYGD